MKEHRQMFAVEKMCDVFSVSRSGYYGWLQRKPSKRAEQAQELWKETHKEYIQSKGRYGSPKITKRLQQNGLKVSRPRVARIMRSKGIRSVISGRYRVCTTESNHGLKISPNILDRDFRPESTSKAWVSDITYIGTKEGWLYLTIMMDLYDRKIIGWSMSTSLCASQTVVAAWKMAKINRPLVKGLIFHSDRGIQYACNEFRTKMDADKVTQSMSRKGNCWDNAVAENFFKILKSETEYRKYESIREAKQELFNFIENWYNRVRIHSALDYLTPEQFGKTKKKMAA